jgi:aminoglycoside 3-N-acetyltransferase
MSASDLIQSTPEPRTRASLGSDLRALGLGAGMLVIVHSSLKSLGWVNGGAVAVIQALQDVLTHQGTLVMPAHSGDLSDPAKWENPPVPESWWDDVRASMPAYDPARTPTLGIGQVPELFRTWPQVVRSDHPAHSFAAWGWLADVVTREHPLSFGLGPGSPLGHVYEHGGFVLLLGAGYDSNTSFHLAEYRLDGMAHITQGAPILAEGKRVWQTFEDVDVNSDDFAELGEAFESECEVQRGKVGSAEARLFSQPAAVDFAEGWLRKHRQRSPRQ